MASLHPFSLLRFLGHLFGGRGHLLARRPVSVPGPVVSEHKLPTRLNLAGQFHTVSRIVETTAARSGLVVQRHASAVERLDATELALRRLLLDLEGLVRIAPMRSLDRRAETGSMSAHHNTAIAA